MLYRDTCRMKDCYSLVICKNRRELLAPINIITQNLTAVYIVTEIGKYEMKQQQKIQETCLANAFTENKRDGKYDDHDNHDDKTRKR